jgi:6-phospho-beta-glucosidase
MGIKLAVIGAASSYTPELFYNLAQDKNHLGVQQVALVDLNIDKLRLVASVCERIVRESRMNLQLKLHTTVEDGVSGADFILPQIRVGGLEARVRDETLPMELGMVGNETTGAGGFVCAMRTVPAMLEIARIVERTSPKAWILNLSNPAGIVTEAIMKHTRVHTLGFCNIPINTTYALAHILKVDPASVQLDSFGLNHLSWTRQALINGEDALGPLLDKTLDRNSILYKRGLVEHHLSPDMLQFIRMIPSWYVRYFYYPEIILEEDRQENGTKGVHDMQAEDELHRIYKTDGYTKRAQEILSGKGGSQYYLPVLQAIDSIVNDRGDIIVVDTENQGSLPDLPANACVEVPARIFRSGAQPLSAGAMPLAVRGLVQTVKAYEELTIEAALTGNHQTAIAALMANPLVGTYPKASAYFERVLKNERDYLPQFYSS